MSYSAKYRFARIVSQLAAVLTLCGSMWSATAHQQKEAFVTLSINNVNKRMEVTHRFSLHDTEHIFSRLFNLDETGLSGDLLSDELSQAALANYITSHFALAFGDLKPVPLEFIGFEAEGNYFWVYQETEIPKGGTMHVKHNALMDIWPDQTTYVNFEKDGGVHSLRLTQRDVRQWRSISWRSAH